jgi:hypothetical protein
MHGTTIKKTHIANICHFFSKKKSAVIYEKDRKMAQIKGSEE